MPAGTGAGQTIPSVTAVNPQLVAGAANRSLGALANYVGNGYVSGMSVSFGGLFYATGSDAGDSLSVDSYTGTTEWLVTYDYAPIPEPTTMTLLLLGTAAVGLRRRFRKPA